MPKITLGTLPNELSIHRLPASASLARVLADLGDLPAGLFATLHSADELSIVCDATLPVAADQSSGPWRAIRVLGELDFGLTGILSGLAAPLAAAEISIFAISSWDTDYLLVRADVLERSVQVLEQAGYQFAKQAN